MFADIIYKNKKRSRISALQESNATSSPQVKSVKRMSVASLFSNYIEDEEETEEYQAPKRLALQDTNISRYRREFVEIELIGEFIHDSCIYLCRSFTN